MEGNYFTNKLREASDIRFRHMVGQRVEFKTPNGKLHRGVAEFIGRNALLGFDQTQY